MAALVDVRPEVEVEVGPARGRNLVRDDHVVVLQCDVE
jgi:hypothetical protein